MVTVQDAIILHCKIAARRMPISKYQSYYNSLQKKFKDAKDLVYFGYNRKTGLMYVKTKVPFEDMTMAMLERIVKTNYYLMANTRLPPDKLLKYIKDITDKYENGYR